VTDTRDEPTDAGREIDLSQVDLAIAAIEAALAVCA